MVNHSGVKGYSLGAMILWLWLMPLVSHSQSTRIWELPPVLDSMLTNSQRFVLERDTLQATIFGQQALQVVDGEQEPQVRARAYLVWGNILIQLGAFEEADVQLKRALAEAQRVEDAWLLKQVFLDLGHTQELLGNAEAALAHYKEATRYALLNQDMNSRLVAVRGQKANLQQLGVFDTVLSQLEQTVALKDFDSPNQGLVLSTQLADWYSMAGQTDESLALFQATLEMARTQQDTLWMINCQSNIARLYRERGNYALALELYLRCLSWNKNLNNLSHKADTYNRIGVVYYEQQIYDQSLTNYREAQAAYKAYLNEWGVAKSYNNIGLVHQELGQLDSALVYYDLALAHLSRYYDGVLLGWALTGKAKVMMALGEYEVAEDLALSALTYRSNQPRLLAQSYLALGQLFKVQGAVERAGRYYELAEAAALEAKDADYYAEALAGRSWYLEEKGRLGQALTYFQRYKAMSDSLLNEGNYHRLALLSAQNSFAAERDSLQTAQTLERVALNREIQVRKYTQGILLGGLVMTLFLIWFVGRAYRQKRKSLVAMAQLHADIKAQKEHLDVLVETKDRFFSIISHDLRGPIHSFSSLAYLLKDHLQKGKVEELKPLMEALESNAKGVGQLLDNLLNWALQQQGLLTYNPEEHNLHHAVEEIFSIFSYQAQSKNIDLVDVVPEEATVYADGNTLLTVIRNLVSNALKFTRVGGAVRVVAHIEGEYVKLSISDDGIGISSDQVQKVFEVDGKRVGRGTAGEKGTGLGLPLVKDFVEANGGTIALESEEGKGTTFVIHLPRTAHSPKL